MDISIHINLHIYTHTHKPIHTNTHTHTYTHTYIYISAAKRVRKYQIYIMAKLYYTAKSQKLRRFVVYNNLIM